MHLVFPKERQSRIMAIHAGKYSDRYLSDFLLPAMTVHCTFMTAACKNLKIKTEQIC